MSTFNGRLLEHGAIVLEAFVRATVGTLLWLALVLGTIALFLITKWAEELGLYPRLVAFFVGIEYVAAGIEGIGYAFFVGREVYKTVKALW